MDIPQLISGISRNSGEVKYRRPQTLPEQIAEQVSYAILRGEYQPGDPVKEQDLADMFQVSRGPIREALRLLEKDGVVRIAPNRGARVTQLSTGEVNDIFEIRAALSRVAARYLCESGDEKLRQTFIDGARRIGELAHAAAALDDYVAQSYTLSMMLSAASGNARLNDMMLSLSRQTIRYTMLGLRRPERRLESAAIWQKVAEAIRDRDIENAGRLIVQLINDSRDAAVSELEKEATAGTASQAPG